ncbi:Holo-[acyl-carrier-protein] synthase [bioreactor metagenome]|uniref:Holo-[acyl-carrier-protein] synthase n=1 Tax=bioreactor metagenome TaxID=1076179 RepID=A0A645FY02_9ZZZZ
MIAGLGTDIERVERVRRIGAKTKFLKRFFTDDEVNNAVVQGDTDYRRITGLFCAKEAFFKSLGTGIRGFALSDAEVSHDALGKPFFIYHRQLAEHMIKNELQALLSISHTNDYAVSTVILIRMN